MRTVVQDQGYNMRIHMEDAPKKMRKVDGTYQVTLTIAEGAYNLMTYLLERIEKGELIEKPMTAPAYVQPSMLADDVGAPLFSMGG